MGLHSSDNGPLARAERQAGRWLVVMTVVAGVCIVSGLALTAGGVALGTSLVDVGIFTVVLAPPAVVIGIGAYSWRHRKLIAAYAFGAVLIAVAGVLLAL